MTETVVQAQILEFLHKSTTRGACYVPNDQQLRSFTGNLPRLTPQQVRTLCKAQEQSVTPYFIQILENVVRV